MRVSGGPVRGLLLVLCVAVGCGVLSPTEAHASDDLQEAGDWLQIILPVAHFGVVYHFSKKWSLIAEFDGTSFDSDYVLEGALLLRWRFHPRWELTGGYRWQDRDIDIEELFNRLRVDRAVVAMAYYW